MNGINLGTDYTQYLQNATNPTASKLESLQNKDLSKASDEELMSACKEFESYFLEMVMKEMTKNIKLTGDDADSGTSSLVDYYKDKTISDLAKQSTEGKGLGLAQQMYEQMKHSSEALTAEEIFAKQAAEKEQAEKQTGPGETESNTDEQ